VTRRRCSVLAIVVGALATLVMLLSAASASADSVTQISSFTDPRGAMPTRPGTLWRGIYGPITICAKGTSSGNCVDGQIHNAPRQIQGPNCTNCRITDMVPNLVYDTAGTSEANLNTSMMLHHFVLFNPTKPDATCSGGDRFLAAGNERTETHLPTPFGYDMTGGTASTPWTLIYHLVNKSTAGPQTVYIQIVYRTRPNSETQPASPVWMDIDNCSDSEYTIPVGYSDTHFDWTSTFEGRLLGISGHLHDVDITNANPCITHCPEHGGGRAISAEVVGGPATDYFGPQPPSNPPPSDLTGATACRSEANYGTAYAGTRWNGHLDTMGNCGIFKDLPAGAQAEAYPAGGAFPPATGYPILKGQVIRLHSEYDNGNLQQQTDVMGIMVGWFDTMSCNGVKPTITGTANNDTLNGTSGNDVIAGLAGNDTINGNGGNDIVCGGAGTDTISGGDGNDTMTGGSGADTFNGGPGTDTVSYVDRRAKVTVDIDGVADDGNAADGGATKDNVNTDVENLTGGAGPDTLTGSSAANVLDGGDGADILSGLGGMDTVTYASRTTGVTVDIDGVADDGNTADGPSGARDNVKTDIENLTGGKGADTLTGNATTANRIDGGNGADVMSGLGNSDTVTYATRTTGVTVDIDGVADDGSSADGPVGARDNVKTDIEKMIGGKGADNLTGSAANNSLTGGLGADTLTGLDGNDTLFANDSVADTSLDCDGGGAPGTADVAHVDGLDPAAPTCETTGP
jgi:hypothetical protein